MGKSRKSSSKSPPKEKDNGRRFKKKTSVLDSDGIDYVDWKDTDLLRRFMSDRAKIKARRVNGNNEQQQRDVSTAIKNAREMALLPYSSRVTTQRGGRGDRRGGRRDRPPRDDDRRPERSDGDDGLGGGDDLSPRPDGVDGATASVEEST
jgi:small subunit ribosomal protein S18